MKPSSPHRKSLRFLGCLPHVFLGFSAASILLAGSSHATAQSWFDADNARKEVSWLAGIWKREAPETTSPTVWVSNVLLHLQLVQDFWAQPVGSAGPRSPSTSHFQQVAYYDTTLRRLCVHPAPELGIRCSVEGEVSQDRVVWETKVFGHVRRYVDSKLASGRWQREYLVCEAEGPCREIGRDVFVKMAGFDEVPVKP